MTLKSALLLACAMLLSGSSSGSGPKKPEKPAPPVTERACKAKGGRWILYPMLQFYFCALDTTDAGKACADDSECQGDCMPAERPSGPPDMCARTLPFPGGCVEHLVNGKIVKEPCI